MNQIDKLLGIGLVFLLLTNEYVQGAAPGVDETAERDDTQQAFAAPKLICLAWQGNLEGSEPIPVRRLLWSPQGKLLGKQQVNSILERIGRMRAANEREGELRPLLLLFEVDPRLSRSAI
jgi:hypothetical protein